MSVSNPKGFHWRRRVEFAETDMAGIAHFSSFIIYMEQAEHALLRSLGTSVFEAAVFEAAVFEAAVFEAAVFEVPAVVEIPVVSDTGHTDSHSEPAPGGSAAQTGRANASHAKPSSHRTASVLTWPRVHCECDYLAPARFEEEIDIFVSVARLGEKSVTYLHRMFLGEREIATGKIVAVCSMVDPESGVLTGIRIPEHLRKLLSGYWTEAK
jgi:acyl-CoA thioesterase FadM